MNYYPHHLGDYAKDTKHLSFVEHGAYRCMLDVYYATEKPLPKDRKALYRLVGARSRQEREATESVLRDFFYEADDGWRNRRADREIAKAKEKGEKAKASASVRWHSKGNANASSTQMRTHSELDAKAMLTNNQEPITKNQERGASDVKKLINDVALHLTAKNPIKKFG